MRILGIETSCDETAVCLIEASGEFGPDFTYGIIGNALHSQIATHAPFGGVFPDMAKREHAKNLVPLFESALEQAGQLFPSIQPEMARPGLAAVEAMLEREPELSSRLEAFLATHGKPAIDGIAITHGPGLAPALWVGVNFARALSLAWDIPLVGVNHLEGHIAMAIMHVGHGVSYMKDFEFPAVALLISGGHTELDLISAWPQFRLLGQTRDDAVGEAFDKAARMLGIPYPGGAQLSRMAAEARKNPRGVASWRLPRPMIREDNLDFSFSGLKTAVLRLINGRELSDDEKSAIALEFENAATDVLVAKTIRAAEENGARTLLLGGGVSANAYIRERLSEALSELSIPLLAPPPNLATDNALMIALAGYFHAKNDEFTSAESLRADPNLKLGQ